MNTKRKTRSLICSLGFAVAAIVLSGATSASAASGTWLNTGAANANWSTTSNWVGGTVPGVTSGASNTDTASFNTSVGTYGTSGTPILFDTARNLKFIAFDLAAVGPFYIGTTGGNALTLTSGGAITMDAAVVNTQTINAPLVLGGASGAYAFTNNATSSSALLNIGGGITGVSNGATVLTLNGTNVGSNTISGVVANGSAVTLGVTKSGAGTWVLNGPNTFTGGLTIQAGTLKVGSATGVGNGTVTLGIAGDATSGTLDLNGQTETIVGLATAGTAANQTIGNSSTSANAILNFTSANTSTFGGVIQDVLGIGDKTTGVTVNNASGNVILSGANTYTGATTVTAGTLKVTGSLASGSAVGVSGGAISGYGTINGAVTVSSTGSIRLWDGAIGTQTLGSLSITGATGANNLYFDLASGGGGTDKLIVNGVTSVTNAGAAVINLTQLGGAATPITPGTYTLIQGTTSMAAVGQFALATRNAFGETFTLGVSGNDLQLTAATGTAGSNASWSGAASGSWAAGNWSGATLGYQANVTINNNTNVSQTLDGAYNNINSLTFGSSATTGNTIAKGTGSMLVIEAAAVNGNTAGNGITVDTPTTGTPTQTISANVGLSASQTWTVNSGAALTVSGGVSDFNLGNTLTKAGSGLLTLSGANTFTGGITIQDGTLRFLTSQSAIGTGAITLGSAGSGDATLLWAISSGTPSNAINVVAGTGTRTLQMNQTGSVTFSGAIALNDDLIVDTFTGTNSNGLSLTGAITGSDKITIKNTAAGTAQTTIANNQNTFTGVLEVDSGATLSAGNGFVTNGSVNVLSGGTFSFQQGATIAGLNGVAGGFASTGQTKTLTLAGSGSYTFAGVVQNGAGLASITKTGSGIQTFSGSNTYTGTTAINGGILNVASLANGGSASGIGQGANTVGILTFGGGTLQYTGSTAQSTDHLFTINTGGATLDASGTGSGTVSFTNTGALNTGSGGTARSLTLTGSNTGTNTIASTLGTGSSTISLAKSGTGTWAVSGANTFGGGTTITAGTLLVNTAVSSTNSGTGTGAVAVSGTNSTLGGIGQITPGGTNAITIGSGSILAPGNSGIGTLVVNGVNSTATGLLTFSSGAKLSFDLNGTNSTSNTLQLLNGASGDIAFNSNVITFALTGGLTSGQQFTLFDGTNDNQFTGLTVNGSNEITGGLSFAGLSGGFENSKLTLSNSDIILNAVPEPATWALLAFSLTTVMVLRRRRA